LLELFLDRVPKGFCTGPASDYASSIAEIIAVPPHTPSS
jgi:hypothetical protein